MDQEYTNKLYEQYTAQRVKLDDASLEAAGRYDRAVLAISTGALALSVTFIDKIASTPQPWTLFLLVIGWLLLLIAIILQLLALSASHDATREQINILDQQYNYYLSAKDPGEAVRNGWDEPINKFNSRVSNYNTGAQVALISGVVIVLAFSAINVFYKKKVNYERKQKATSTQATSTQATSAQATSAQATNTKTINTKTTSTQSTPSDKRRVHQGKLYTTERPTTTSAASKER